MEIIKFYNGLEFWVTPETLPGKTNMYTARVSRVGGDPILKVILAVQDPESEPVSEDDIPEDVLDALFRQLIDDVFGAIEGIVKYDDLSRLESILGKNGIQ